MHLRQLHIIFVLIFGLSTSLNLAWADLEDVELELEGMTSDSEAAIKEAKDAKHRLSEEKEQRDRLEAEAKQKMAEARQKEREARIEIASLDKEIVEVKKDIEKFEKEKRQGQVRYDQAVENMKVKREELSEEKRKLAIALREKQDAQAKLDIQIQTNNGIVNEINAIKVEIKQERQNLRDNKTTYKNKTQHFQDLKKQKNKERVEANKEIQAYKKQIRQYQDMIKKTEKERQNYIEKLEQKKQEVALGRQALDQIKQDYQQKKQSLDEDKRKISSQINTLNQKNLKRLKLKKTCNVRSKPSTNSRVVIQAGSGQVVSVESYNTSWYRVLVRGKKYFISKNCF